MCKSKHRCPADMWRSRPFRTARGALTNFGVKSLVENCNERSPARVIATAKRPGQTEDAPFDRNSNVTGPLGIYARGPRAVATFPGGLEGPAGRAKADQREGSSRIASLFRTALSGRLFSCLPGAIAGQ